MTTDKSHTTTKTTNTMTTTTYTIQRRHLCVQCTTVSHQHKKHLIFSDTSISKCSTRSDTIRELGEVFPLANHPWWATCSRWHQKPPSETCISTRCRSWSRFAYLYIFEGVTHHGDEHVDEDDDDGDVVESEQEHPDSFHHRRGVVSTWKAVRVRTSFLLRRIFYLDTFDAHQSEHRPEQAVQGPWQPANRVHNFISDHCLDKRTIYCTTERYTFDENKHPLLPALGSS